MGLSCWLRFAISGVQTFASEARIDAGRGLQQDAYGY